MNKCINCNKEYEAKRTSSKFCSDRCRIAYNRKVSVTNDTVKVSVTQPEQEKTNKQANYKVIEGKGFHGEKMYFCNNHQEHCKRYCDAMCDDTCKHITEDEQQEHKRCIKCGERIIDIKEQWVNTPNEEQAKLIDVCIK
jgi:hypothetical protein